MDNKITMGLNADELILQALREDISSEDVTTNAVMRKAQKGEAQLICKQDGVLAGLYVFRRVFELLDGDVAVEFHFSDGDKVKKGDLIGTISGDIRAILSGERTALNFLQRMSGIATYTNSIASLLEGSKVKLLDTRKTTPNMRIFEKYSVKVGGGYNHRYNLSDGILLKDNHIGAAGGVKELILVAQETTLYGVDLYGKKALPELLRRLCQIEGICWLRVLYSYPEEITEELIQVIKEEEKICHYLDIPVQSGSDAVLKRMGRKTDSAQLKYITGRLRQEIPDICLRTTLIAGFPGESEEDHQDTLAFVDEMEFDRLGGFTYSQEEDTPAAGMPGQVPEETKERRRDEIMGLQQEIAFEAAGGMVGKTLKAIIEGKMPEEGVYVARTYKDAPGVDGYLFVNTSRELLSGDFVEVTITGSNAYDLIGELEEEA